MIRTRNPWLTLAVLAVAQFVVVLDVTIVNVALPQMQRDLHFSADGLQWVVSAYTLFFGGFMLLGGRVGDLLGRRSVFMAGLALFGVTSLLAGFAQSPTMLVVVRAAQGLGGALLSPAALSLLMVAFAHGRQRNIALGIWSALAGIGGIAGAVIGGALVDSLSWRWVFFVNVPIAAVLIALSPVLIAESKAAVAGKRVFDIAGALLGTGGLLAIVLGVIQSDSKGWGSGEVSGLLAAGVLLLAGFVFVERRSKAPLIPLELFKSRGLTVSTVALALNGAAFLATFFLTAIFLQEVRGYSALHAGVAFIPMGVAAVLGAMAASSLVRSIGTRNTHLAAALLGAIGLYLLSQVAASSSYVDLIVPGIVGVGIGVVGIGVPSQINAIADIGHEHAGAASGVVQTGYQVGAAIGLAVITTLSNSHVSHLLATGADPVTSLVGGYDRGLLVATVFGVANLLVAFLAPQLKPDAELIAEAGAAASRARSVDLLSG